MGMLARIVVVSYVSRVLMMFTMFACDVASWMLKFNSTWFVPRKRLTVLAAARSGLPGRPIENVRMGVELMRSAMAHTRLESTPPERRKPIGLSVVAMRTRTASSRVLRRHEGSFRIVTLGFQ